MNWAPKFWVALIFGVLSAFALGWGHVDTMTVSEWEPRSKLSRGQEELVEEWTGACSGIIQVTELGPTGGCLSLERFLKALSGDGSSAFSLDVCSPDGDVGGAEGGGFIPEVVRLCADELGLPEKGATIPTERYLDPVIADLERFGPQPS